MMDAPVAPQDATRTPAPARQQLCSRCNHQAPGNRPLVAFGEHTGKLTLLCPACSDMCEHQRRGRILPDHPIWRLAPELAKWAERYLHEHDRGQPSGRLPEALRRLRETVGMALPQPFDPHRWRRVARRKGLEPLPEETPTHAEAEEP